MTFIPVKDRPISAAWRFLGLLLLLLPPLALSCSDKSRHPETDRKAIEQVLEKRRAAMQTRDLPNLLALLSPKYKDKSGGLEEAKKLITDTVGAYDKIEVRLSNRKVEVSGDSAEAVQDYFLIATSAGLTQTLKGTEKLRFRRENEAWVISGGLTGD